MLRTRGIALASSLALSALVATGTDARAADPDQATAPEVKPPAAPAPAKDEAPIAGFDATDDTHRVDYRTPRYEPAGFPLIGGNSDIGFQFGGVGTLTRFEGGAAPYLWNMDIVLTASLKNGPEGREVAQQNYLWQWDLPKMAGGKLRLTPLVYYQRTINQPYFGLGNASSGVAPANVTPRYFQYIDSELRARQMARFAIGGPWEYVLIGTFRAEAPTAYDGSQLAHDAALSRESSAFARGVRKLGIGMAGTGFIYDSRDNEIFPHAGAFHQLGLRIATGFPNDAQVAYAGLGGSFAFVYPLGRDSVLAWRGVFDFLAGNVPFYDMFTGGPFQTYDLPGGPSGIRGVPSARYLGRVKLVGNVELRSLPIGFRLFDQRFRLGGDLFADAGRTWLDYTFSNPLDGSGLGIKYGLGAGIYLLWGQAALFRLEVAYSPDQVAENPGFPVGIYVEDGVMF